MYNSVVAPECRLSRNIRENFAVDFRANLQVTVGAIWYHEKTEFNFIICQPAILLEIRVS